MKTIKIAHLYYDLMNLYGENGNMRVLVKRLEEQSLKIEVSFLTIGDHIDFDKYDLYYIGSGSELALELVLEDIIKYKKDISKAIENNKFFLITGNAIDLFGKYIEKSDKSTVGCLSAFDFYVKETNFRIVGEQIYKTKLIPQTVIGFQNRSSTIFTDINGIFQVEIGTGFKPNSKFEGFHNKNFYGTYLIGPLLVRNPYFTEYLIKQILESKKIKYKKNTKGIEFKAYDEFMKNYVKQ